MALPWLRIRLDAELQPLGHVLGQRQHVDAFGAADHDLFGAAPRRNGVEVEIDGGPRGGNQRVLGIVFRAL